MKASQKVVGDFRKRLALIEPDTQVGDVFEFKAFSLSMEALATVGLARAREVGSRYLSIAGDRVVFGSGPSEQMALEMGPLVKELVANYRNVQRPTDDYEIRILVMPAAHLEAVWYYTPSTVSTDLIVPYLSLSPHFLVSKIYSDTDFVEAANLAYRDQRKIGFIATGPD